MQSSWAITLYIRAHLRLAGVVTFPKWCHTRGPGLFLVICDICDMYCVFQSHVDAGVVTFTKWCHTRGPGLFSVSCNM